MAFKSRRISPNEMAKDFVLTRKDPGWLEKFWVSETVGWGLKTKKSLMKGDFIIEYRGVLLKDSVFEVDGSNDLTTYIYEFRHESKSWTIDATHNESLGKFINDSKYFANGVMKKLLIADLPRLCLFALKNIDVNEEIRYCYGEAEFPWHSQELNLKKMLTSPPLHVPDVSPAVVLIGATGSGKSATANTLFSDRTNDLFPTSSKLSSKTFQTSCKTLAWRGNNILVTIVDTPGLGDTTGNDLDNFQQMVRLLKSDVKVVNAFLLIFNGQDPRSNEQVKTVVSVFKKMFMEKQFIQNLMVGFTRWENDKRTQRIRKNTGESVESKIDDINKLLSLEFGIPVKVPCFFIDNLLNVNSNEELLEIYGDELPVLLECFEEQIGRIYQFVMGGTAVDCTELRFSGFSLGDYNEIPCTKENGVVGEVSSSNPIPFEDVIEELPLLSSSHLEDDHINEVTICNDSGIVGELDVIDTSDEDGSDSDKEDPTDPDYTVPPIEEVSSEDASDSEKDDPDYIDEHDDEIIASVESTPADPFAWPDSSPTKKTVNKVNTDKVHKHSSTFDGTYDIDAESRKYDPKEAKDKIIVPTAKHTSLKRDWKAKRHTCVFCNKSVSKLPIHFKRHHKNTIEISRYLSLEKKNGDSAEALKINTKERSLIISSLRKSGNFNHNVAVRERGYGIFKVERWPSNKEADYKDYLPCEHCLGFYSKHDLSRHVKN